PGFVPVFQLVRHSFNDGGSSNDGGLSTLKWIGIGCFYLELIKSGTELQSSPRIKRMNLDFP
uniref:hypothetical protein n=1 Tax=Cephaloticoccus sp. TaxID=1985742 RepID=UPI00404B59B5